MKRWMALALAAGMASPAFGASKNGTSTATFLRLEQGARAIGMGGAFTAAADDAGALWWNPAGMARAEQKEVAVSHTQLFEQINTQFASFVLPIPSHRGAFGTSFTYLTIPGLEGRDAAGNFTGKLDANAYAAAAGYALKLDQNMQVGATAKLVGQTLATDTGTGFAADVGFQLVYPKGLAFGLAAQNLGPDFKIGSVSNALPTNFRGGISYPLHSRVLAAVEGESPTDGEFKPRAGAEFKVSSNLMLRAGYAPSKNLDSSLAGVSLGFSILRMQKEYSWAEEGYQDLRQESGETGSRMFSLDYAFTFFGELDSLHRVSLSMRF